jgi:lipopolysaccharide transport system ATP-binding protein
MGGKNNALSVENISKCYRINLKSEMPENVLAAVMNVIKAPLTNYKKYRSLYNFSDMDPSSNADYAGVIWALRDISFEVEQGDVLGIIGRNGAGKSTLLKVLSRITDPTRGMIRINGRVSSLLEVGTGFHPELSGRENVFLNGTILGMTKKEVAAKFDEIVEFSGVSKFIDTPVKRYSSGMKVRLAFAVAAHLEPEILIIDEVLAVGDAEFQKKCLGKMQDISSEGRTVLFVSHNMSAITQLCPKAILINQGRLCSEGPSKEVVQEYLTGIFTQVNNMDLREVETRTGDGRLRFTSVYLQGKVGGLVNMPISGEDVDIVLEYESMAELEHVQFVMTIFNQMGVAVTHLSVESAGQKFGIGPGPGRVVCSIPRLPLPLGQYKISISANDAICKLDAISTALIFDIVSSTYFHSSFMPPMRYATALIDHTWSLS